MKKFLTIYTTTIQRALTYRFNIFTYRAGAIVEIVMMILLWSGIYLKQSSVGGYSATEMITYILIGNIFATLTRNFLAENIARDIKDGTLSAFLVKPTSYLYYIFCREIGRITLPFLAAMLMQTVVMIVFRGYMAVNTDFTVYLVLVPMLALAFLFELLLAFLFGLAAFWTDEVDGIYASASIVKKFFSGSYFPLSLLPPAFATLTIILPYAYSFYVPAQIYLNRISLLEGIKGMLLQITWIIILSIIVQIVWRRGIKKYEGIGI